ncbi:MAG: NAD(P)-dependent oxidoreductase [Lysinibacillus sp.]
MYAMMVNVQQQKVVVIGGGKIAYRRVRSLLAEQADITIISLSLHEKLHEMWLEGCITWHQRDFQKEDVLDAFIVIAATNDGAVNAEVVRSCSPTQLVQRVDDAKNSRFHVPATVHSGDLTLAISTGGASPKLAKRIKQELSERYHEYGDYIDFLKQVRKSVLENNQSEELLEECLHPSYVHSKDARDELMKKIEAM